MALTNNIGMILVAMIVIVAAILATLIIIEKRLRKKVIKHQGSRNLLYLQQIEKIDKTDLGITLTALDKIARNFFKEAFMIKQNEDYSSLENLFKQKGNTDIAKFCMMMNNALYSGEKTSKANNEKLILILEGIIKNNPLFTDEELERMKEEKIGVFDLLKNVGISGVGKKEVNNKQDNSK